MRAFAYERPTTLQGAVALLAEHGSEARLLAGGTDLIIRLRDGSIAPRIVVDLKRIAELDGQIREHDGGLTVGARAGMTDIAADGRIRRDYRALAEAGPPRPSPGRGPRPFPAAGSPPRSACRARRAGRDPSTSDERDVA